jgi:lipoprotein signal peptidase
MEGSVFRRTLVNAQKVFMDFAVNSVSLLYLSNYGINFSGIHSSELKEISLTLIQTIVGMYKQITFIIFFFLSSNATTCPLWSSWSPLLVVVKV